VVVTVLGKDMAPPEVNVAVADGVCEACDPAPVTSAVLVREAAEVTHVAQPIAPAEFIVTGDVPLNPAVPICEIAMALGRLLGVAIQVVVGI